MPETNRGCGSANYTIDGNVACLTGYACVYTEYQVHGYRERFIRECLTDAALTCANIPLRYRYDGKNLAETDCGTLKLDTDRFGLAVKAMIKTDDAPWLLMKPVVYLGFSFQVKPNDLNNQDWSEFDSQQNPLRTVRRIELRSISISVADEDEHLIDSIARGGTN